MHSQRNNSLSVYISLVILNKCNETWDGHFCFTRYIPLPLKKEEGIYRGASISKEGLSPPQPFSGIGTLTPTINADTTAHGCKWHPIQVNMPEMKCITPHRNLPKTGNEVVGLNLGFILLAYQPSYPCECMGAINIQRSKTTASKEPDNTRPAGRNSERGI